MNWQNRLALVALLLAAVTLPYLLAFALAGPDHVFGGFLLNPADGNSYLAKMQQGFSGEWRFHLPYSAEPGDGAYLFLFYIAAGHLARLVNLPLPAVFHLLRILSGVMLALVVMDFLNLVYKERPSLARTAAWLALFGSGMGWLVVFAGLLPSDVWVAETYPFLSAYANPHFPLGLALLLWGLRGMIDTQGDAHGDGAWVTFAGTQGDPQVVSESSLAALEGWKPRKPARMLPRSARPAFLALDGLLLAVVLPFGMVVLAVVTGGLVLWRWIETKRLAWRAPAALLIPGGLFLLYQYWAALSDPVLAGWNAQNQTPAPPLWDFLLSLSPALPLAVAGAAVLLRNPQYGALANPAVRVVLVWAAAGAVLAYLPFPLQRRFLLGYYLPLAALAVFALDWLNSRLRGSPKWPARLLFGLALPTNLVVILLAVFGAVSRAPEIYLTRSEAAMLDWLRRETQPGALVLASPEMGLFIPAHTRLRVIYGHPFETVNAPSEEECVTAVYQGELDGEALDAFVLERGVDYILVGARERSLGSAPDLAKLPVAFAQGDDRIYIAGILP